MSCAADHSLAVQCRRNGAAALPGAPNAGVTARRVVMFTSNPPRSASPGSRAADRRQEGSLSASRRFDLPWISRRRDRERLHIGLKSRPLHPETRGSAARAPVDPFLIREVLTGVSRWSHL